MVKHKKQHCKISTVVERDQKKKTTTLPSNQLRIRMLSRFSFMHHVHPKIDSFMQAKKCVGCIAKKDDTG